MDDLPKCLFLDVRGLKSWNAHTVQVFKAARMGNLKLLKKCIREDPRSLYASDPVGNSIAHAAAKENKLKVLILLLEMNLDLNTINMFGQIPLHLSCLYKNFETAAFLLQLSVDVNAQDVDKFTPLHLAAKSGNLELVFLLILSGAYAGALDCQKTTPLHFAAYSGNANLCSLLLRFAPSSCIARDHLGNTPLHIACCTQNLATAFLIVKASIHSLPPTYRISSFPDLRVEVTNFPQQSLTSASLLINRDGDLPEDLAHRHGLHELAEMIKYEKTKVICGSKLNTLPRPTRLINFLLGPPGRRHALLFYMILISFGWMYPYLCFRIQVTEWTWSKAIFVIINCVMWFCFFKEYSTDPGYLTRNTTNYEAAMQELLIECRRLIRGSKTSGGSGCGEELCCKTETLPIYVRNFKAECAAFKTRLGQLCHTCGCVKPLRSKHCGFCNRCVSSMDHHCPVTDNCVGESNRVWFLLTGLFVFVVSSIIGYLTIAEWRRSNFTGFWEPITLILLLAGWSSSFNAFVGTTLHAMFNVTTNEIMNWSRYDYLKTSENSYHNPFDRGYLRNISEFIRPRNPNSSNAESEQLTRKYSLVV